MTIQIYIGIMVALVVVALVMVIADEIDQRVFEGEPHIIVEYIGIACFFASMLMLIPILMCIFG